MNIKIEIYKEDVSLDHKSGVSAKSGKPYNIYEQTGYLHQEGSRFPLQFKLSLEQGMPPYNAGVYEIAGESLYINQFGSLSLGRLTLIPVASSKTLKQA